MQEQIDPGRQRVESTPHRNPELQVWEQLPTPEKPVGDMQRQHRGSADRSLQLHGQSLSTETCEEHSCSCLQQKKNNQPRLLFSRQCKMRFANPKSSKMKACPA